MTQDRHRGRGRHLQSPTHPPLPFPSRGQTRPGVRRRSNTAEPPLTMPQRIGVDHRAFFLGPSCLRLRHDTGRQTRHRLAPRIRPRIATCPPLPHPALAVGPAAPPSLAREQAPRRRQGAWVRAKHFRPARPAGHRRLSRGSLYPSFGGLAQRPTRLGSRGSRWASTTRLMANGKTPSHPRSMKVTDVDLFKVQVLEEKVKAQV